MSDRSYPDLPDPRIEKHIEDIIADVKKRLAETGEWPDWGVLLIRRVRSPDLAMSEDDEEMLSLVIDDFSKGVDIRSRYPIFFDRLLENPRLRTAFLDTLEIIAQAGSGEPDPVGATSTNLDFLASQLPKPTIELTADSWRAAWQLDALTLRRLFSPLAGELVRGDDLLEDPWFVLVRSEMQVAGLRLLVNLEAAQDIDEPGTLNLQLAVFETDPASPPAPALEASISWNAYQHTIPLREIGPTQFPAVAIEDVMDPRSGAFTGDIHLLLQPAT